MIVVGIKSSPIFFKKLPKSSHSSFYLKSAVFQNSLKFTKSLGYFGSKFAKNFQKLTNLVTN